jgi:hypothetical protein
MGYGISIRIQAPFAETASRVRDALKAQGFGVLTEIDMRATLRDKLGQDMEDYLILGACNEPCGDAAELAPDPDRVQGRRRVHDAMVAASQVTPHHLDQVTRRPTAPAQPTFARRRVAPGQSR